MDVVGAVTGLLGGGGSQAGDLQKQVNDFGEALLQGAVAGLQSSFGNFQNIIKAGEKVMKEEAAKNSG